MAKERQQYRGRKHKKDMATQRTGESQQEERYSSEFIYRVHFRKPRELTGEQDYYFRSLKGIFLLFKPSDIGCGIGRLWNVKLAQGGKYKSDLCIITREKLYRQKRDSGRLPLSNLPSGKLHDKTFEARVGVSRRK